MKLKIEDILFWVLIVVIIAMVLWMFRGSQPLENILITFIIFIISSELLIWKKIFAIDKNTAINFAKFDKNVAVSFAKLREELKEIKNSLKKK